MTTHDLFPAHAFPGGYPIVYYDRDNCELCPDCAAQDFEDTGTVAAGEIRWEGTVHYCAECGCNLESAYGPGDEQEEDAA